MKKILSILLSSALVAWACISAFAADNSLKTDLTGKNITAHTCYKIQSSYYFQSEETGKWYRLGNADGLKVYKTNDEFKDYSYFLKEFDAENYYTGNDIQAVKYRGKTYIIDCKKQAAYLDGKEDTAVTKMVRGLYEAASLRCRAHYPSGTKNNLGYINIPYYKVIFEDNFNVTIYAFDDNVASGTVTPYEYGINVNCDIFEVKPMQDIPICYGDINTDKSINMKDVISLQKNIAGLKKDIFSTAADVNADKNADMKDVVLIQQHIAALE